MSELQLNLARKWRSQSFDQVIGQELVIRLLKNSLYRQILVPVYLLAGMRGCGKTSVGRLFAAALNCAQLRAFRELPQNTQVPCWQCLSCRAMQAGQHPDFIEIDAASHTGVDNIRNLIDTASFVPVMGTSKIYLIDEAHMLSRAAFNALLKILEEPPHGVVFMLATTDSHKVPDTIRSRCFQLFFKPILSADLVKHLVTMCTQEQITYELEGLELIAHESEGSVRDAINLLERIRLSYSSITKQTVCDVLGFLNDELLLNLVEACLLKDPAHVLQLCSEYTIARYNIMLLWKKLIACIRTLLLAKQGLSIDAFHAYTKKINYIIEHISNERLIACLEICYTHELAISRTTVPHPLFEMVLIKLCQNQHNITTNADQKKKIVSPDIINNINEQPTKTLEVSHNQWQKFMHVLEKTEDHLVISVFRQAVFLNFNQASSVLEIQFAQNLTFFKEMLDAHSKIWKPVMISIYGSQVTCQMQFTGAVSTTAQKAAPVIQVITPKAKSESGAKPVTGTSKFVMSKENKPREASLSITDSEKWPKAQLLSKIFPGTITHIKT
jgi:DNA polymerase III subunit gamma/tau